MSGPGPGPGGRGGWSPVHFRPCSPYGPSPPPRFGSPGANMMGTRLPPHMACPRPRWPTPISPVPMGMSPSPGPRPFRRPMHPPSPAVNRSASPDYFRGVHPWSPSEFVHPSRDYEYVGVPLEPPPLPHNYDPEDEESGPSTAEIIANQSQDYIDEKLAEYQMTIYQLQGHTDSPKELVSESDGDNRSHLRSLKFAVGWSGAVTMGEIISRPRSFLTCLDAAFNVNDSTSSLWQQSQVEIFLRGCV